MDEKLQNLLDRENFTLATFEQRILAYIVDYFIVMFIYTFLFWGEIKEISLTLDASHDMNRESVEIFSSFVQSTLIQFSIITISYETIFVALYGATLGKIFLKIRTISTNLASKPNFSSALARAIGKYLGANVLLYITFIFAFGDKFRRSLHDRFCKTLVVQA